MASQGDDDRWHVAVCAPRRDEQLMAALRERWCEPLAIEGNPRVPKAQPMRYRLPAVPCRPELRHSIVEALHPAWASWIAVGSAVQTTIVFANRAVPS